MHIARLPVSLLTYCFILAVFLSHATGAYAATEAAADNSGAASTLFLPLKINTPGNPEPLAEKSDQLLTAKAAARGQAFLKRDQLGQIGHEAICPPPLEKLWQIIPQGNIEYIVCGSITQTGNKLSVDVLTYDLRNTASPHQSFYQEAAGPEELASALDTLADKILAFTGRLYRIAKIEISGNTRIDSGAILRHIQNRAGDPYNPAQLRDDLKNIYKMGYFDDVQIKVDDSGEGKNVTFLVKEKEVVGSVNISGEEDVKAEDIREVITVSANTILNPQELKNSTENIRKLYKEKGYYETEVTTKLTYPEKERVNILFEVKEGSKIYVKEIIIHGNKSFASDEIKKTLTTSTKTWLSWITEAGLLKRDILNQDASRISAFYQNHGFIEALVGDPEVEQKGEWLYVTFNITEGDRYKVGVLDITGDLIEDKATLTAMTTLGDEKYFNRQVLRDDVLKLTDYYASKGYAFAEVEPQVDKNTAEKRVDVTLHVSKGDLVHINRIIIKGNTRTRDKVIRRAMLVDEKSLYDATALKKSTERLQQLDFFEDVNITPEPTADEDDLMDVIVELKEKATGTFSIGAGYSSVDGLLFMSDITQHNFLGRGQSVSLQANLGGSNTHYNLSFTEPHLNDSKLAFGFDVYHWTRDFDDYDKQSIGTALRFSYPIVEEWRVFTTWAYDDSELSDVSDNASQIIRDSMDINTTHSVTLGLSRDTRNRRYNPTKGSLNSVSAKKAGSILGGDSAFTKYEASTSWYFPFIWDNVIHVKGSAGYVAEDEEGKLPVYEKFYLGGLSTMRGFENGDISPRDPVTNEKIGGEKMAYMNLEYIFPLVKDMGLNALVFYDLGNSVRDSVSLTDDLRSSAGFGFRWLSPMGPLRLEWGYNIDPKDDEDQSLWDFSIGGQF
ncbi:MAG: outer membrane protein assembly factor BamA [Deltaproteobacteria bacterium]|nr:outer membrane protein assembly factor BamA [Deltaproteobacteria bacterium]